MNKNHSTYLKAITGVLLISKDGEDKLYCIDDMQRSKYFTVGQIFNAIRVLYGKEVSAYGKLWPHYKDSNDNISNDWLTLQQAYEDCDTDYDFLVEACKQLNEEVPEIVPKDKVNEGIEIFKAALAQLGSKTN